jgi:ComF family protein
MWPATWSFAEGLADLVWPRNCTLCGSRLPPGLPERWLCDPCEAAVSTDPFPTCPRCSSTVGPHVNASDGCLRCVNRRYRFDGTVRLGVYDGRLRQAVLVLKHAAGEPLAEYLGRVWTVGCGARLTHPRPTVVIPVPLHWWRRVRRGYNQSAAVARGIAGGLGLPMHDALCRPRPTPTQTTRSATERWANVQDAFRLRPGAVVRGERVLLVDDVLTTGATADAASGVLLAAGAAQVWVAVLAHR